MDKDSIIFCILCSIVILFFILGCLYFIKISYDNFITYMNEYKLSHDFSTAVVIDTHVGYSLFGTPCYFIVYKFSSGIIEQTQVSAEEYYNYLNNVE